MYCKGVIAQIAVRRQVLGFMLVMENGDTEKYHPSRVIQNSVFLSRKRGCIRCISLQVYNNIETQPNRLQVNSDFFFSYDCSELGASSQTI